VARLDPAAPGGHDAEAHLTLEHVGAVAIAVDGNLHARRDRAARERPVEIEMGRRSVDLEDCVRRGRDLEQPVVIEVVAGSSDA
jgi:hypothetical protein